MAFDKANSTSIFVDLSNFYTRLLKSELGSISDIRRYFIEWFDFSVLAAFLTGKPSDVWIFYSSKRLGPSDGKIEEQSLREMMERFDRQSGVGVQDVNIPGDQREPYFIDCPKCSTVSDAQFKSEKGIDSSLTVHLFDTIDSWARAFILSGDADFVPAVRSLRRRGKIVNGCGLVAGASKALVRECFEYVDLKDFLLQDFLAFSLFGRGGKLTDDVEKYFLTSTQKGSPRLIYSVELSNPNMQTLTFTIESNHFDIPRLRAEIGPSQVRIWQSGDPSRIELYFDRSFLRPLSRRAKEFMEKFSSFTDSSSSDGLSQKFRYYVQAEARDGTLVLLEHQDS